MFIWIIVVAVLALAALAWYWQSQQKTNVEDSEGKLSDWRPRAIRPLTQIELQTLSHIKVAAPNCIVLPQVSLSRFLRVKSSLPYSKWFYKVGRRCVDFLICSPGGDVLGVVELQGEKEVQTHISRGMLAKERALAQASIPIWYLNPESKGAIEMLRTLIHAELGESVAHSTHGVEFHNTDAAPRGAGIEAIELDDDRWNQAWPTEETRPSAFLDIAELEPLDSVRPKP